MLYQCAIKQFHKLDGLNDEIAGFFGLNYGQKRFVQDAVPGSDEKGYSQSLLGVDGEWRGMEVRALPRETEVIENERSGASAGETDGQDVLVSTDDD